MTTHIRDLISSRRALLGGMAGLPLLNLGACATVLGEPAPEALSFAGVAATNADTITLPPGYAWRSLIAWGDPLFQGMPPFDPTAQSRADQELRFGQNNDMIALFAANYAFPPQRDPRLMLMCVNQEYFEPALMFPNISDLRSLTRAHLDACLAATGVTVLTLEHGEYGWRVVRDAAPGAGFNRRITPFTPVLFSGPAARHPWIEAAGAIVNRVEPAPHPTDASAAIRCGTYGNCAGGQTPWGTYLSAEENFHVLFTATDANAAPLREAMRDPAFVLDCANFGTPMAFGMGALGPPQFDMSANPYGQALYGWTLEVDPYDPAWTPRKRTALGRRKGECATTALARNGRVVVYSGDDQIDEFVYKFVSNGRFNPNDRLSNRDLLDDGQLYVAQFHANGAGAWLPLTLEAANAAARRAGYSAHFSRPG